MLILHASAPAAPTNCIASFAHQTTCAYNLLHALQCEICDYAVNHHDVETKATLHPASYHTGIHISCYIIMLLHCSLASALCQNLYLAHRYNTANHDVSARCLALIHARHAADHNGCESQLVTPRQTVPGAPPVKSSSMSSTTL